MIRSMTAFARVEAQSGLGDLVCELRSVNHRYLDLSLRLPEDLRALEGAVREAVAARLERGKVDLMLRWQPKEDASVPIALDADVITRVAQAARQVSEHVPGATALRTIDVLRWPGVLRPREIDVEGLGAEALALLSRALDELVAMREREGKRLAAMIGERLDGVERHVAAVRALLPEVVATFRERLEKRLAEVREQLDPARLEQEIVMFAQKTDVAEELDRLGAHVAEARKTISQPAAVGRRLDFLMQEFNREANTLASKSADVRVTNIAVELKVLIEQMREQVQNIE